MKTTFVILLMLCALSVTSSVQRPCGNWSVWIQPLPNETDMCPYRYRVCVDLGTLPPTSVTEFEFQPPCNGHND